MSNESNPEAGAIGAGKVVSIQYVLKDPEGKELDRADEDKPLRYLHGARNIVPGLEEGLEGKQAGDETEVLVLPSRGYGVKRKVKPQRMLRSHFPKDAPMKKGMQFMMQNPKGEPFPVWVTKIMGREIQISPQHPLAGVTLRFAVKVLEVRPATEQETEHGHAHGPGDGHDHGDQPEGQASGESGGEGGGEGESVAAGAGSCGSAD